MSLDFYKQVMFNDGEGLTPDDLNNAQQLLDAKVFDQLCIGAMGNVEPQSFPAHPIMAAADANPVSTIFAYCISPGRAYLTVNAGVGNNQVRLTAGILLQAFNPSGDNPLILSFRQNGSTILTISNGSATNPRIDLIQMKLEYVVNGPVSRDFQDATTRALTSTSQNKDRRVQCTVSVKPGTPGASPVIPDPDTGFCALGAVFVGSTWTSATPMLWGVDATNANASVWDLRMPLSVKGYRVFANQMILASNWTLTLDRVAASNASNILLVPCPILDSGRLVGVAIDHDDTGGNITSAGSITLGSASGKVSTTFVGKNSIAFAQLFGGSAAPMYDVVHYRNFDRAHAPATGPTVQPSAVNAIGIPVWTNGLRSLIGLEQFASSTLITPHYLVLSLNNISTAIAGVTGVTFFVAGGM